MLRIATGCCLCLSIILSVACTYQAVPTETPRSSSIYTVPSHSVSDPKIPEETTVPAGFYGDKGLADALVFACNSGYQGTVLIWKDEEIRLETFSGFSDVDKEILCVPETTYEIGSITRQFTAVGVMMLFEEGILNLDAPLSEYIPEYTYADRVTVRMLLSMTSGIPDYLKETVANRQYTQGLLAKGLTSKSALAAVDGFGALDSSFESILEIVQEEPLLFEPGTGFSVSNTGYVFLAEVIERVSGIPYIHFMQKNILTPAGLDTASFSPSYDTATGYLYMGTLQYRAPNTPLIADGGLRMSAKDLLVWMQIIHERRLLTAESWELILDPGQNQYGMGFAVLSDGSFVEVSDIGGFSGMAAYVPSENLVVIILLNRNSDERWAEPVLDIVYEYYGIGADEEPPGP